MIHFSMWISLMTNPYACGEGWTTGEFHGQGTSFIGVQGFTHTHDALMVALGYKFGTGSRQDRLVDGNGVVVSSLGYSRLCVNFIGETIESISPDSALMGIQSNASTAKSSMNGLGRLYMVVSSTVSRMGDIIRYNEWAVACTFTKRKSVNKKKTCLPWMETVCWTQCVCKNMAYLTG